MDFATSEPTTPRRKWMAIGLATLLMFISYIALVAAWLATGEESGPDPAPLFAFGLALVPFVFAALAFGSRHENAPVAVLKAMGVWLLVALPVGLLIVPIGLCVAFGMGGMMVLRREEVHTYKARSIWAGLAGGYVLVLIFIAPPIGLLLGGLVPFAVLGMSDMRAERRAARQDLAETVS